MSVADRTKALAIAQRCLDHDELLILDVGDLELLCRVVVATLRRAEEEG